MYALCTFLVGFICCALLASWGRGRECKDAHRALVDALCTFLVGFIWQWVVLGCGHGLSCACNGTKDSMGNLGTLLSVRFWIGVISCGFVISNGVFVHFVYFEKGPRNDV